MTAIYSEIDPYAAGWLRRLADAGHIAPGEVRGDIHGLAATDLVGRQVHLFAGIGGWSLALRLAGIPDNAPIWTGSCPCQPFSQAGKRHGTDDVRHLWPVMRGLVAECLPPVVVGEQVASADGRAWLANVRADLEELGYAVGAADLCAAGVGAPHIRQRLYWGGVRVADAGRERLRGEGPGASPGTPSGVQGADRERQRLRPDVGSGCAAADRLGDTSSAGLSPREREAVVGAGRWGEGGATPESGEAPAGPGWPSEAHVGWSAPDWLRCRDGRWRPVESGTFPLATGISGRVGQLRGYGNAIVPQVAARFLTALLGA